jgi:hypothetical protein
MALECLSLWEEFIIGQNRLMCRPAEDRALPLSFYKVIHRVIHRLCRGVGGYPQPAKPFPQVLSSDTTTYILPNKKYTLK